MEISPTVFTSSFFKVNLISPCWAGAWGGRSSSQPRAPGSVFVHAEQRPSLRRTVSGFYHMHAHFLLARVLILIKRHRLEWEFGVGVGGICWPVLEHLSISYPLTCRRRQGPSWLDTLVQKRINLFTKNDNYRLSLFTLFIRVNGVIGWRQFGFVTLLSQSRQCKTLKFTAEREAKI